VEEACKAALKEKIHLKTYLLEKTDILTQITEGAVDELFNAKNALGVSDEIVGNFISNLALRKMNFEIKKGKLVSLKSAKK
jgi:hypothetical protein